MSSFHTEVIAAYFFWGNVRLRGWLQKDAKKNQILKTLRAPIQNQGAYAFNCVYCRV